jgi:hypothetical protein
MDEPIRENSANVPHQPDTTDWGQVALRAWVVVLAIVAVVVVIKIIRRGGAGMAVAVAAPVIAAASASRTRRNRRQEPQEIDQDFLKLWLSRGAKEAPLITPTELCDVLNNLFRQDGRPEPFDSPGKMARELKKLGLQSSVRSVPGRPERRWYDLTGYGTHESVY